MRQRTRSTGTPIAGTLWPMLVAACTAPGADVRNGFDGSALAADSLPVSVRRVGDEVEVVNAQPGLEARFLVFERRGTAAAYGVYGAHGAKRHMRVAAPLRGEAIAWPGRDHAQALARLLELTGVEPVRAGDLVGRSAETWFRDGLRVFVAAPGALWVFDLDS